MNRRCLAGLLLLFMPLEILQGRAGLTRIIRICVVDDTEDPVPRQVMSRALAEAEQAYRGRFGVNIKWTYEGHSSFDPDGQRQLEILKDRCGSAQDFGAVFTAKVGPRESPRLHRMGSAYPEEGYFRIYTGPVCVHQLGLQEKINAAFEHEFAHMWGATHDNKPGSLMYPTLLQSREWSNDLEQFIRRNLDRRWWRLPESPIMQVEHPNTR